MKQTKPVNRRLLMSGIDNIFPKQMMKMRSILINQVKMMMMTMTHPSLKHPSPKLPIKNIILMAQMSRQQDLGLQRLSRKPVSLPMTWTLRQQGL